MFFKTNFLIVIKCMVEMKRKHYLLFILLFPTVIFAQVIIKPIGCFAGTNGLHDNVLSHPEVGGVLLIEKWSEIEPSPGVYDFTNLNGKIDSVRSSGLKYALAISGGAFGSPEWLIDSLGAAYHSFQYQNQNWKLPLWWDSIVNDKLTHLSHELGGEYASDTMLSHVYVTQMSVNGIEGHLNGVDMAAFAVDGFTDQRWVESAVYTSQLFANSFPTKPIVFEVHEIGNDTIVPVAIISDLLNEPSLCERLGLGMWWISGKTSYQSNLIDFISNFNGDKYAQIIGRSDQLERFKDSLYSSVFTQAKELEIRYIEPWPYEFQHHTHDSLFHDFNLWASSNFTLSDTCISLNVSELSSVAMEGIHIFPNPTQGNLNIKLSFPYQKMEVHLANLNGEVLLKSKDQFVLNLGQFPKGMYVLKFIIDNNKVENKKIIIQ